MNRKPFVYLLLLFFFLFAAEAGASSTSVGAHVSRGQSDSTAYSLNISQKYEPWIAGEIGELAPIAELGGHVWVDDDSSVDKVWGAYLAPGLRFTLFTNAGVSPYLEGSFGGAVNSEDKMDDRNFGSHALFRTRGSVGVNFGGAAQHRLQGDFIHYSTGGLTDKNDGYSSYGVSYGYSF